MRTLRRGGTDAEYRKYPLQSLDRQPSDIIDTA